MIHVVIGTKAQLIKMAPIMRTMKLRGIKYRYISTGQHRDTMDEILSNFGLPGPDLALYSGVDITSIPQMLKWAFRILWRTLTRRKEIFENDRHGIVLVHGDTFSTLLGAIMGKVAGLKVGHVESGLRSFDLLQPFPEELTRILTFWCSDYYFCPGDWAEQNLKRFRGIKINTGLNTLVDSLRFALPAIESMPDTDLPHRKFGIVTLHRYENVFEKAAISRLVECVERIANRQFLLFILHKPTKNNLEKFGLYERLSQNSNIEMRPRYDYLRFMKLMKAADFVVSDGGSNQEECYYWGKPVLLLRNVSERPEGIGQNAVISRYEPKVIDHFLDNVEKFRFPMPVVDRSPSEKITDACLPYA
jgi:UDP-N-acetylglucosamine 2-epimerase (non-hydrolysing)